MGRISDGIGARRRRKRRLVLALALSLALVLALAVTGGIVSAASSVSGGTSAVKQLVAGTTTAPKPGSGSAKSARNVAAVTGTSSALAQYGNKVVICHHPTSNPSTWVTISVSQSALKAHLKHGDTLGPCTPLKKTRLTVTITPPSATLTSGIPANVVIVTKNAGNAVAYAVITCVSLPKGITVVNGAGGFARKGSYCWNTKVLGVRASVTFRFQIRGDSRLAGKVNLVAAARAFNAPGVGDASKLTVLPGKVTGSGGYTG